jgi:hypothetical protein
MRNLDKVLRNFPKRNFVGHQMPEELELVGYIFFCFSGWFSPDCSKKGQRLNSVRIVSKKLTSPEGFFQK